MGELTPNVPDEHTNAVAHLLAAANGTEWDVMPGDDCVYRRDANAVLTSPDPAVIDALVHAVTRTPEGREKALAALVEAGVLRREDRRWCACCGNSAVIHTTEIRDHRYTQDWHRW